MKRARFTEEQIIGIPHPVGAPSRCEMRGPVPQVRHVRRHLLQLEIQVRRHDRARSQTAEALEDENAKLKKLLGEQMLDLAAMKELRSKKW